MVVATRSTATKVLSLSAACYAIMAVAIAR